MRSGIVTTPKAIRMSTIIDIQKPSQTALRTNIQYSYVPLFRFTSQGSGLPSFRVDDGRRATALPFLLCGLTRFEGMKKNLSSCPF